MEPAVFNTLTELEMRDERERMQNAPAGERILALNPEAAKLLYITALSAHAKNIVEVGTNRGYSTIWLALVARQYGGKVTTCEIDPARAEEARGYFEKAGLSDYIDILVGDARETLRSFSEPVDLLFIDAVKDHYETYFDVIYKQLGVGSLVIADNAVSHSDELLDYIMYVQNHPNLESITVPLGSGLEISVKTGE